MDTFYSPSHKNILCFSALDTPEITTDSLTDLNLLSIILESSDTIKQNESPVGEIQIWFYDIIYLFFKKLHFDPNPHVNQTLNCWDMANSLIS